MLGNATSMFLRKKLALVYPAIKCGPDGLVDQEAALSLSTKCMHAKEENAQLMFQQCEIAMDL